jgi:hypothetical protein
VGSKVIGLGKGGRVSGGLVGKNGEGVSRCVGEGVGIEDIG